MDDYAFGGRVYQPQLMEDLGVQSFGFIMDKHTFKQRLQPLTTFPGQVQYC